ESNYREQFEEPTLVDAETKSSKAVAYERIEEELKTISERVAAKLQEFEESKTAAHDKLRQLSKLFTEPSDNIAKCPEERYTLRGVCADPKTVYVQERSIRDAEAQFVELDTPEWQWWKLSYEAHASQPVECTKVREIEVLKAARDESPNALLVYASDRAMAVETQPLPPQLKAFVDADNQAFATELATASPGPEPIHLSPKRQATGDNFYRSKEPRSSSISLPEYDEHPPAFSSPQKQ
ncbi:MAG: hypothetical protein Q9174_007552, partial [Haloplaca sp. 1 TL-2023]